MSSLLSSQGMALATAMAVSGTVILLALSRQKPLPVVQFALHQESTSTMMPKAKNLRSCLTSSGDTKSRRKKKRVHFAAQLVEAVELVECCDDEEVKDDSAKSSKLPEDHPIQIQRIPENRMALYNGILRDRLLRTTLSY